MIYIYIILALIILYLLFTAYCKIRFRFWSKQPVFHLHNLWYWAFPPGIIQHKLPPITKFYDPLVEFSTFDNLSTEKKELFWRLNKQFYLKETDITYSPTRGSIFNYFEKHASSCFISLLFENNPLFHYSKKAIIPNQRCIGSMTTRPLHALLHGNKFDIYYVDYLCVAKKNRKKGVAPRLIYSHYVHSRKNNKNTIFLFKREGAVTFIVPLTCYYTYGFSLHNWKFIQDNAPPLLITKSTFHIFFHYLQSIQKSGGYECCIHSSVNHLKYLVERKQIYIFLLLDNNKPWGCFIFRNPHTRYRGDGMSLDCIASHCSILERKDIFVKKFYSCIPQIKYNFKYLLIENISHNYYIIPDILQKRTPFLKSTTSYYFYNFAYRPFLSKDVFLVG